MCPLISNFIVASDFIASVSSYNILFLLAPCGAVGGLLVLGDEEVFVLTVNPMHGYFFIRAGVVVDGEKALEGQLAEVIFGDYSHFVFSRSDLRLTCL